METFTAQIMFVVVVGLIAYAIYKMRNRPQQQIDTTRLPSLTGPAGGMIDSLINFINGNVLGVQVDAGGNLIEGKADLAEVILQDTFKLLAERGLAMVVIENTPRPVRVGNSNLTRPHWIVRQAFDSGDIATLGVRVVPYGNRDLEVSWRLFEDNPKRSRFWKFISKWLIIGGILTVALFFWTGIGIALGFGQIGSGLAVRGALQRKTTASTYGQFDSLALAATVNRCLADALTAKGVNFKTDVIVLKRQGVNLADLLEQNFGDDAASGF